MCQVHGPEYRPPQTPQFKSAEAWERFVGSLPTIPRWALVLSVTLEYSEAGVRVPEFIR